MTPPSTSTPAPGPVSTTTPPPDITGCSRRRARRRQIERHGAQLDAVVHFRRTGPAGHAFYDAQGKLVELFAGMLTQQQLQQHIKTNHGVDVVANNASKLAAPVIPLIPQGAYEPVSYTHLRAHETRHDLVCRLLLEK